jgi:hypothetical protein
MTNEADVSRLIRLEAAAKGILLWRNNVGALRDTTGRWVRYGLANDSAAVNKQIKSADFIGIRRVTVTQEMVGMIIGQFVSREIKEPGWKYHPSDMREIAQDRWARLVNGHGGDAAFATGEGTL